ncbi:hypothetical protein [Actinomadura sp. 9N215]|uniref:hypothetical protein n=1 Tax=Actinomadura sp. 9N215 TaxID=3375150 RepID=UPI0037B4B60F
MFLRGFRRRTGKPSRELAELFRSIAAEARGIHPMASDFLTHFMDGAGAARTMSPRWLRSFKAIRKAEEKNHRRFERQLARAAGEIGDGDSTWLHDHWDARVNAFIGTELFYVSRMSLLRSQGSFVLTRSGAEVRVSGTVRHHWFDPYDWDRGRWVYIPRHGFVPIAVGRDLVEADEARNFLMESRHVHTVEGTCAVGGRSRRARTSFAWALTTTEQR